MNQYAVENIICAVIVVAAIVGIVFMPSQTKPILGLAGAAIFMIKFF